MIIDGHAHIYPDKTAKKIIRSFTDLHRMEPAESLGKGTADDLAASMKRSHAAFTVIANFGTAKDPDRINSWTLRICSENKGFIPLVSVTPGMPAETLKRLIGEGAAGVKMHNGIQGFDPADPGLDDIYAFCCDNRIPVTFHCGETSRVHLNSYTDMERLIPVAKRYPEIPFVMTHLAAGDPDTLMRTAEECPNALFDTSIAFSGRHCIYRIHDDIWENDAQAVRLFRRIGCDRIAFGSDYPFGDPAADIERILSLSLTDTEKKAILGGNTASLYKL